MDQNKIKQRKLICKCNKEMKVIDQLHVKGRNIIQLKYDCECKECTGLVILDGDEESYNQFIKDKDDKLIGFDSGGLVNDE